MLSLLISVVTIAYMYLLSRRIKAGLYFGLFAQVLWVLFIFENKAWGLLPLNIALWYVCVSGIQK